MSWWFLPSLFTTILLLLLLATATIAAAAPHSIRWKNRTKSRERKMKRGMLEERRPRLPFSRSLFPFSALLRNYLNAQNRLIPFNSVCKLLPIHLKKTFSCIHIVIFCCRAAWTRSEICNSSCHIHNIFIRYLQPKFTIDCANFCSLRKGNNVSSKISYACTPFVYIFNKNMGHF